jgi:branched-chain amino acid transport system ATP-binding protein
LALSDPERSGATAVDEPAGLAVRSVSVSFGGVTALDGVDIDVRHGEIVGLIGPNGAGKSTLVNCVGGQLAPQKGSVVLGGRRLDGLAPFRRARLGIGRTFQRVAVFPELTVRDHLFVAVRAHHDGRARASRLLDRARPTEEESNEIEQALALTGLSAFADTVVGTLPLGVCRLVEVGRALVGHPTVLLADEPSSGLDGLEASALAELLRTLPESGMGVLLVEHDLALVASVCDRVIVLHLGAVIASGSYDEVMADPAVRTAYLGAVA